MNTQLLFSELQRLQEEEQLRAHEAILQHDEEKESRSYSRRSAFSEFEMWLDIHDRNNSGLTIEAVMQELKMRSNSFQKEAEKFYNWNTNTTALEYQWQAEALTDYLEWLEAVKKT